MERHSFGRMIQNLTEYTSIHDLDENLTGQLAELILNVFVCPKVFALDQTKSTAEGVKMKA